MSERKMVPSDEYIIRIWRDVADVFVSEQALLDFARTLLREQNAAPALPAAPSAEPNDRAWLVELQSNGKCCGWIAGDPDNGMGWTLDSNAAIRFARKQDADWFRQRFGYTCDSNSTRHLSTEHLWVGYTPAPSPTAELCARLRDMAQRVDQQAGYSTLSGGLYSEAAAEIERLREERDRWHRLAYDRADEITALENERSDWARRFKLNDVTPWEWMTRATESSAALEAAQAERDAAIGSVNVLKGAINKCIAERDQERDAYNRADAAARKAEAERDRLRERCKELHDHLSEAISVIDKGGTLSDEARAAIDAARKEGER